ncbi:thioredoxin domain-containing protein [Carboxylicivirga sediminis]|uniref:Thioredoxin domain-containing protein n=1 Tax=Carboxylicivirga sediminis TaxID=2006564 RepID=A0A941F8H0_9BACT|nr:thioredoxin domain-containing protein [Carboxylicivirga sediminis]MBR8537125.1 thioredoxin domain-containing protein [Carboxylicivirga sediminis]
MHTNQLIHETSPYLLQHAHNPVNWYPWGDEALQKAKDEDKLLLISVGYSACHWCHVMEHESFEDEEVAQLMNAHFICIKVDREERPDVDQIYMEAVQMLTGRGGWPLNCFALPDGRPVWGGTYFPKAQWMAVLQQLAELNTNGKDKLLQQAEGLTKGIQQLEIPVANHDVTPNIYQAVQKSSTRFDEQHGGFGGAPKFPMPVALKLIHQTAVMEKDEQLLSFVHLTFNRMASGGIYDQAGGGFARYSVDERWFAPHFEKMLYDNAQLIALYSQAYKASHDELYKRIVLESIAFVKRELTSPEGIFYSALDADSEGEEGLFYVWDYSELKTLLGDDEHFFRYFNITENGNWENGNNILHGDVTREAYARQHQLDPKAFNIRINTALEKLFKARAHRVRPGLDDKALTSWNALMITSLCEAYQAFGEEAYLQMAESAMKYLLEQVHQPDGSLLRTTKNGVSKITAFLDDYAFMLDALISLYEVTFNEAYLHTAQELADYTIGEFYNATAQVFYYTAKSGEQLIARKTDVQDNVIPSSVGAMANNLIRLHQLIHLPEYEAIAKGLIARMTKTAEEHPTYYAQWALLAYLQDKRQELVIAGSKAAAYRKELQQQLRSGGIYAGSVDGVSKLAVLQDRFKEGATLIYKCQNKTCELPVDKPSELR